MFKKQRPMGKKKNILLGITAPPTRETGQKVIFTGMVGRGKRENDVNKVKETPLFSLKSQV